MKLFDSFLEVAGNLGFLVGDNDRRRVRARKERRSWGTEMDGLAVSIAASTLELKSDDSLRIEIALRNTSSQPRIVRLSAWLRFFSLQITDTTGQPADLSSFGRSQFEAAEAAPEHDHALLPGAILEAEIPAGVLYNLKHRGVYTLRGQSRAGRAISNEIQIRT